MNAFVFSFIAIALILPLLGLLGLLCYVLWYTLKTNSGIWFTVSWQGKALITWELQNTSPDGRTCRSSLITAQIILAGKGYKAFLEACSPTWSCSLSSTPLPTRSPSTSSVSPLPRERSYWSTSSLTPSSTKESLPWPSTMMTLFSLRPSPSSKIMSWSAKCLPASPYHVYLYRSPRPSTLPCPLLLWYKDQTLFSPLFTCLRWSLTLHLCLPFQLHFSQMVINTLYGNPSFSLHFPFTVSFYDKHSSPKEPLSTYLVSLSHHPSLTFYNIPLVRAYCRDIINTMLLCTTSLKLDLYDLMLQSSLIILRLSSPSSIRANSCLLLFKL